MSESARRAGFTLLEMIVALVVLSVLVSLVYGMVRLGSRSWESGVARIEETDAMRIGWTFLQRSLNNTRAVPSKIPDTKGIHFFGEADRLEYVAEMPAYLGSGGLHVLTLSVDDQGHGRKAGNRLVLRRTLLIDYDTEDQPDNLVAVQQAVLVDQLDHMEIEYYGTLDDEKKPAWHTEWQEQKTLPVLVKLVVTPDGQEAWPVLIAHPRFGGAQVDEMDEDLEQDEQIAPDDVPGIPAGEGTDDAP